jgi:hypothetical protein
VTLSRLFLMAALGLALPAIATASAAQAAAMAPLQHHSKRHVHAASSHSPRHHKPHHIATIAPHHTQA